MTCHCAKRPDRLLPPTTTHSQSKHVSHALPLGWCSVPQVRRQVEHVALAVKQGSQVRRQARQGWARRRRAAICSPASHMAPEAMPGVPRPHPTGVRPNSLLALMLQGGSHTRGEVDLWRDDPFLLRPTPYILFCAFPHACFLAPVRPAASQTPPPPPPRPALRPTPEPCPKQVSDMRRHSFAGRQLLGARVVYLRAATRGACDYVNDSRAWAWPHGVCWHSLCTDLEVIDVPGDHFSILRQVPRFSFCVVSSDCSTV